MFTKILRFVAVFALLICGSLAVFAHEGREVGEYLISFGWRVEPAYAGLFNGPEVSIELHDADEGTPFPNDIVVNLRAEVSFGDQTTTIYFERSTDNSGHFIATLIPTLPGDYTFRILGSIGDVAVDESFSSVDGEFSTVEPASDVLFPVIAPANVDELSSKITALEAKIAELEAIITELQNK